MPPPRAPTKASPTSSTARGSWRSSSTSGSSTGTTTAGEVRFERGQQQLDGERPVELWTFRSADDERAGARAYRLQAEAAEELLGSALGRADIDQDGPLSVQVLNGVGVPGVGQLVDGRVPEDARITLTGNASSFDFDETRILVYTEDAAAVRDAERVQDALGLGTIQVSRQPQSVVDVAIVVGEGLLDDAGG